MENQWELREMLVERLSEDAKTNFERMTSDSSNLNRRNYIRSLFALYESIISNQRELLASRIVDRGMIRGDLDIHMLSLLMDETATISNGKKTTRIAQFPFKEMVKFLIILAAKEYQISQELFNSGWNEFINSIKIRHKITHPKYENDILISDIDLEQVEEGLKWWNRTFSIIRMNGKI